MTLARRGITTAVVVGGLLAAGSALAATPAKVTKAVDKWVSKSVEIQKSSIVPTAQQGDSAASAAVGPCQSKPQGRPYIAEAIDGIANALHGYVHATETGELALYRLAPALGSKHNATRKHYVKLLDNAGNVLDNELADVKDIKKAASQFGSGDCSAAAHTYQDAVGTLAFSSNTFVRDANNLKARFG
jgi:hypothetical protein